MAILPIRVYPDPVLLRPAAAVTRFDAELHRLLDSMAETMYVSEGIGLAAPQVGVSLQVVVVDVAPKEQQGKTLIELINPQMVSSTGQMDYDEGCLSFPGLSVKVRRPAAVVFSYQDRQGAPQEVRAEQLLAICLQHELDHLQGITMLDRVNALTRRLKLREYNRLRQEEAAG